MKWWLDKVVCGDCLKVLAKLKKDRVKAAEKAGVAYEGVAELVFADPPFNIGYEYDEYQDNVKEEKYAAWTRKWMQACVDVLKPDGSFYVAIGDDFAAQVRLIGRELGLHLRNWIVWYYTFGQSTTRKFARSHTHIFYFVRDSRKFYFDEKSIRVLSDRQKEYNDRRANAAGKVPDDVWTQFPRVCGTFRERLGDHPCQMPESLLVRIIRASCRRGNLVIDPFAGSGTTLVAAKKLGRRYLGIELSQGYVRAMRKRLRSGEEEAGELVETRGWSPEHVAELVRLYQENEVPTSLLAQSEKLLAAFTRQLNGRLNGDAGYNSSEVMAQLDALRRETGLPRIRAHVLETPTRKRRRRTVGPSLFGDQ